MSRSNLPKSRTEGKGKTASATPAVTHEIIPGRLNDQEWNGMIEHDGGDEFAMDIMEEICAMAMDTIYQNYIQKQLVPYTVSQAKDAILQIIEWQFLARDNGEINTDADVGWAEDEEPAPAVTDCWAQGSVPKQKVTPRLRTPVIQEEDEEPMALEDAEDVEQKTPKPGSAEPEVVAEAEASVSDSVCDSLEQNQNAEETELEGSEPLEESEIEGQEAAPVTPMAEKPKEPSQSKFKPYTGRLGSAGVAKMTESLDDTEMKMLQKAAPVQDDSTSDPDKSLMPASCHSIIKLQAGRPPGNNDVVFDESGNLVAIYKLDPEKLPNHKVKTGYKVIDPAVEAAQARLKAMRTGKYISDRKVPRPPTDAKPSDTRHAGGFTSSSHTVTTTHSKHIAGKQSKPYDVVPLPPPLIETVSVAPGVIIREGDQIRKGPKQHSKKLHTLYRVTQKNLNPVSLKAALPTLTVAELLEHQTPVVKPMVDNLPIPPIAQHAD